MSRLSWDQPGAREYEIGVDRGVLFPDSMMGVAWSGLTTVTEKPAGGEARSYYLDGKKYLADVAVTEFAATIEAFSAPPEFDLADGKKPLSVGLSKTHQVRKPFAFSYRTRVGNDTLGFEHGYKIHLVYNAIANPAERTYETHSDSLEPLKLSWDVETVAQLSSTANPTSHLIFDSRVIPPELMSQIEDLIYGSEYSESQLAPQETLLAAIGALPFSHRNIWANPSFETPSTSTAVVQTNYHNNPQGADNGGGKTYSSGYGGWAGGGGNVNHIGYGVAMPWSKSGLGARVKWDTVSDPSGDFSIYFGYSATVGALTAGQRVTLVFSYTTPVDGIPLSPPKLYGAANAQFSWVARSREDVILSEAGVIYEDWCTFVLPATWDDNSRMTIPVAPQNAGDYIEESMGNLYLGDYDPDKEWFSGTVSYDEALIPSWVGNGNNSVSRLTGTYPTRVTQSSSAMAVQSKAWAVSRLNSIKIISKGGTDTFAALNDLSFVQGQTYTILATCRMTQPQVNQINLRPRRIDFFYKAQGSSAYTEILSDQAPNEAGETKIRFIFTVPIGSSGYILRLYNGSDRGAVWWDDVLITPEVYGGEYFDGNTESPDRWTTYSWDDPNSPDNSPSTKHDWVAPL